MDISLGSSNCQEDSDEGKENQLDDIQKHFNIIKKIGEGTFSSVYLAQLKGAPKTSDLLAVKYLIPTSHPSRIENELRCLKDVGGSNNIIGLKFCLRQNDCCILAMPYFQHDRFSSCLPDITVHEIQDYMLNLFMALEKVHSKKIIHRDIKPSNFLYNRKQKKYSLVDFGLAQRTDVLQLNLNTQKSKVSQKPVSRINSDITKSAGVSVKRKLIERTPDKISPCQKRIALGVLTQNNLNKQSSMTVKSLSPFQTPSRVKTPLLNTLKPFNTEVSSIKLYPPNSQTGFTKLVPPPGINSKLPAKMQVGSLLKSSQEKMKNAKTLHYKSELPAVHLQNVCNCYGLNQICRICLCRGNQVAARAGTPGFRAPEVLLKYPNQTTALDLWSAGVIFLCLLSGRYPFFNAPDDMIALAEIITLFGDKAVKQAAQKLDKQLVAKPSRPPLDLAKLCRRLRRTNKMKGGAAASSLAPKCESCRQHILDDGCLCYHQKNTTKCSNSTSAGNVANEIPDSAFNLLYRLLELDPNKRITASEALKHPFLVNKLR